MNRGIAHGEGEIILMESRYTIHIMPAEWRWVILAALGLVFLAFLPFAWIVASDTGDWQAMGVLHNYQDGASYLAKMAQGEDGAWLIRFQHTPDDHDAAFLQPIYPLLGHVARLTMLPTILVFHVARVGASLFMYLALYYLAASIWQRVRARRLFFVIAAIGSGFGWLYALATQQVDTTGGAIIPDLQIPEAFPLASTIMNVHFPLALGCLALLLSIFISAFRPGGHDSRELGVGIPTVGLLGVALGLLYPQALVPLGVALVLYVLVAWFERRQGQSRWALRWSLSLVLPVLPLGVYYMALVARNPAFAEWNAQNVTTAPSPLMLLVGFGLPLLIGLPALFRAIRRFEQVDDRLMLLWLAGMIVLMYLPTNVQRRFMIGMMLPVAYFATRAVEEVWFPWLGRRYRGYALAVALPLMATSHLFVLFLPALPAAVGQPEVAAGVFLENDYLPAFRWLNLHAASEDVVLAAPVVAAWLPGWAGTRVVYGHPYETLNAAARRAQVESWYASSTERNCASLLEEYRLRYVLVGPQELRLGPAACAEQLALVETIGQVRIYAP